MNLSKRQVDCLTAMGIELWQAREPRITDPKVTEPQVVEETLTDKLNVEPVAQPPVLVAQLQKAIDYCKQQKNTEIVMSWKIEPSLEQIEVNDTQLSLPNLTKVFASAKLKQQLWHLIHHTHK